MVDKRKPSKLFIGVFWTVGVLLVLISIFAAYSIGYVANRAEPRTSSVSEPSLIEQVNQLRQSKGLRALEEDPLLNKTARIRADDMASNNYFSHDRPDGTPWYDVIYKNHGADKTTAENIAECFDSNAATIDGWINSKSHYDAMIDNRWTKIGIATVWDEDRACYITVNHFSD